METPVIERRPIDSSFLRSGGYDPSTKIMHVEFANGSIKAYQAEPIEWSGFEATFGNPDKSSGKYFNETFRGRKCDSVQVGGK